MGGGDEGAWSKKGFEFKHILKRIQREESVLIKGQKRLRGG